MERPQQEALGDLLAQPWCRELLEDPEWKSLSQRKTSSNELLANLLWTARSFRAWQSFYRSPHLKNVNASTGEYRLLLSLGADLAGWQGVIHGGVSTMILDEAMQELAFTEMQGVTATKTLSCSFERPLTLPTVVMARAWAEEKPKTTSRKIWVRCQIIDGDGNVFVCGRALFIKLKGKL